MTIQKNFTAWNFKKIETDSKSIVPQFKIREIFWARVGENIGFEQSGSGHNFIRPVLILRKFNNHLFWGIPLTTAEKSGKYYLKFEFIPGTKSVAILSQLRLFDARRLEQKIGTMSKPDFSRIKKATRKIVDDF